MSDRALAVLDTSVLIDPPTDYTPYADAECVSAVSIGASWPSGSTPLIRS